MVYLRQLKGKLSSFRINQLLNDDDIDVMKLKMISAGKGSGALQMSKNKSSFQSPNKNTGTTFLSPSPSQARADGNNATPGSKSGEKGNDSLRRKQETSALKGDFKSQYQSSPSPPRRFEKPIEDTNVIWYRKNPTWRKLNEIDKELEKVF